MLYSSVASHMVGSTPRRRAYVPSAPGWARTRVRVRVRLRMRVRVRVRVRVRARARARVKVRARARVEGSGAGRAVVAREARPSEAVARLEASRPHAPVRPHLGRLGLGLG